MTNSDAAIGEGRSSWLHRTAHIIVNVAAAVGIACVIIVLLGAVFGYRPIVLVSGSMAPEMPAGTLVITRPVAGADVRVGDVLTVPVPGTTALVTHRVTHVEQVDGIWRAVLRGDANRADDAAPYDMTSARISVLHLIGIGKLLAPGFAPYLVAAAVALVVIAFFPARRSKKGNPGV